MTTPHVVEAGQIWRDTDRRRPRAGEFTIISVVHPDGSTDGAADPDLYGRWIATGEGFARVARGGGPMPVVFSEINLKRLIPATGASKAYVFVSDPLSH